MPAGEIDVKIARKQNYLLAVAYLLLTCWTPAASGETVVRDGHISDSREAYSPTSPQWLRAVGKLRVPGQKITQGTRSNHLEDCSASLVAGPGDGPADTIITAWHCLEYYGDLSKSIVFTLFPASTAPLSSEVYRLADGGGMYADWAILRLYTPITAAQVDPLRINPGRAHSDSNIIMAGYSRDAGLGKHGRQLTYDAQCMITRHSRDYSDSNCRAHRGASGGAVVQLSDRGDAWFSGVISQGDGAGISTFVPVDDFRTAIKLHLR